MKTGYAGLEVLLEWERADGVASPELAATWCALEIRVNGRPVTLVEDARSRALRRSVHTSAYPLAEWVATRWRTLHEHVRPSATAATSWTWAEVSRSPWLRDHNVRGAGDGMPWPDLTLVPEGSVTRLVWTPGDGLTTQPVTFLLGGDDYLPMPSVRSALAAFVEQVLVRLQDAGVLNTPLQREWAALAELDAEEAKFASAAARLGLDPFDVDEKVAREIERLESELPADLVGEFLDSSDPRRLPAAVEWIKRAREGMRPAGERIAELSLPTIPTEARPWDRGYAAARAYRTQLGLSTTDRIELSERVGMAQVAGDAAGLHGLMGKVDNGLAFALPDTLINPRTERFAQARAIGFSVLSSRTTALLDPTRTDLAKQTRAFAAELLAPADGISEYLSVFPDVTDRAIDAVADRYDTSPVLIQRQYDNQRT